MPLSCSCSEPARRLGDAAGAQSWPQRPVRFIIPFGPGAGADIGARLIQEKLSTRWGKPVVIENRPGGDSMIAIQAVLSANDDHVFYWGPSGSFIVHPHLYQKLPYEPADILPIARFSATILSLGTPAAMNFTGLADFVARARAEGGKFNAAAVPGITEFAFDYFAKTAGLTFTKVPYRDIVQAVNDLAEGRLQVYTSSYAIQRPHREGGRVKVLAQMGRERAPSLPDIPTGGRAGLSGAGDGRLLGLFGSKAASQRIARAPRRRHRGGRRRPRGRGQAQRHRADAGARRRQGVRRRYRAPARPDRRHRQGARHPADAVRPAYGCAPRRREAATHIAFAKRGQAYGRPLAWCRAPLLTLG